MAERPRGLLGRVRAAIVARRPLDSELRVVQQEVRELRRETQARLLQYNHLLARLSHDRCRPRGAAAARCLRGVRVGSPLVTGKQYLAPLLRDRPR